jgi:uncharacterized protein (DUF305 family)
LIQGLVAEVSLLSLLSSRQALFQLHRRASLGHRRHRVGRIVLALLLPLPVFAQADPHLHHHQPAPTGEISPAAAPVTPSGPSGGLGPSDGHSSAHDHAHDLGPAGATYDLRWLDAMVQHHTGALRMSVYVFDIGEPGVGALARDIWRDQAQEIKAMGQWRRAWYPEAPVYPVMLRPGGNPDRFDDLIAMDAGQIEAMRMIGTTPNRNNRVTWFLEGMIHHHGGALRMAHDALRHSRNPTIRRMARQIIVAQRRELIQLRRMLQHDGLNKPDYYRFDSLFSL